jgi:hypothetical protein
MQVYGMPLKAIIHEKFGDGIMSAIDFSLEVDKVEDPKGDRVQVTMCAEGVLVTPSGKVALFFQFDWGFLSTLISQYIKINRHKIDCYVRGLKFCARYLVRV